jgi:hypothetical protein
VLLDQDLAIADRRGAHRADTTVEFAGFRGG